MANMVLVDSTLESLTPSVNAPLVIMLRTTSPPLPRHLSLHMQSDDTCRGDGASSLPPFSCYFIIIICHMFFFRGEELILICMHFAMCLFSFAHMILVFFNLYYLSFNLALVCKLIIVGIIMHVQVLAMKQWWANLCDLMQLEFEVDDDEQLIFDVLFHTRLKGRSNHGGSWIGHNPKVWWEQKFEHDYIWWDYFCDDLVYNDHFSKQCYKIYCILNCQIMDVIVAHYFYL
jgi:hypothetical protein